MHIIEAWDIRLQTLILSPRACLLTVILSAKLRHQDHSPEP